MTFNRVKPEHTVIYIIENEINQDEISILTEKTWWQLRYSRYSLNSLLLNYFESLHAKHRKTIRKLMPLKKSF